MAPLTLPPASRDRLYQADRFWHAFRQGLPVPEIVRVTSEAAGDGDVDVIVCGGTLGIFIACALQCRGWRVAVLEKGVLRGRDREWNISRTELAAFLRLDLLAEAELERAIATEYNPGRIAFHGGGEFFVRDVLNIGIDPVVLLDTLKAKFLAAGGVVWELTTVQGVAIAPDGVCVRASAGDGDRTLAGRLAIDAMGHFSPIARQARGGVAPDGICLVVGGCATGLPQRDVGDLIATIAPAQASYQEFWEAFPARDGRTTYLFTYLDPRRNDLPSLEDLAARYLAELPRYQEADPDRIAFVEVLCGFFPAYRRSPLQSPWPRLVHVGDSSGAQSPLSFGGFGAMVRHLERLTLGIDAALRCDALSRDDLALLQPYQPNLGVTWLFQQAMLPPPGDRDRVNRMLSTVFAAMHRLGDGVLKPFLQDVVQFGGLSQAMLATALADPLLIAQVAAQVGGLELLSWLRHYAALGIYAGLDRWEPRPSEAIAATPEAYRQQQHHVAWTFGSGRDGVRER